MSEIDPQLLDAYMLRECYRHAVWRSEDDRTQNAAAIIPKGGGQADIIYAANTLPRGVLNSTARRERPLKYKFMEHAERNAIYHAAAAGKKTDGGVLYCPWNACAECARAIIQAGIVEVVGHKAPFHPSRQDWKESINLAKEMFAEAGVLWREHEGTIGSVAIRFDGNVVWP